MILKKIGEEYKLYGEDDSCIATTQESPHKRLSKQNCNEIFGIVDVEKLAESHAEECYERNGDPLEESYFENRKYNFKEGFNKAMELNKDKLFTVEDMKAIFAFGHVVGMNNILAIQSQHSPQPLPKPDSDKLRDEVIQSLQQPTEIEVEMIYNRDCYSSAGWCDKLTMSQCIMCTPVYPLKDENGCLILKKK